MVAIVVPVYRQTLTDLELISYRQLLYMLGSFEIIVVAPEALKMPKEIRTEKIQIQYFAKEYFQSVDSYSQLMLSQSFYKRFIRYQYILIYQLDAFVFKNELNFFCNLGYDYIGAPWISGFCEYTNLKRKILYVGNGGFSLRRVEACIEALECKQDLLEQYSGRNEDAFFSACDDKVFKIASKEIALSFAFEREVKVCFEKNERRIPFGCHAWERYDLDFWKKYIERFGYDLSRLQQNGGEEDVCNSKEYLWMRRNTALMESDSLFFGIPKKVDSLFNAITEQGFYLWGAGYIGRYAKDLFLDLGMSLEGFIDTDRAKQGRFIERLMVYSPEEIKKNGRIIVTVEPKHYKSIVGSLESLNFVYQKDYIFFEDILPEV